MLEGHILDEIRAIPGKHYCKFFLQSVERKLENKEITEENALDLCGQIVLDYQRHKREIIDSLNRNEKITIIDAIMGSGKSTYIINEIINKNPQNNYLCVLPTLDECQRYATAIEAKVYEPKRIGTKTRSLQQLIVNGKNIVTTHALIQNIDDETMDLLRKSNYHLIIDECLDVVHPYENNFKASDLKSLFEKNYVVADDNGFLIWNEQEQKDYDGRYNDIKQLCKLHSLMCLKKQDGTWSDKILMWNFPVAFFSLFEKCYIATYLWNGSIQMAYFKLHDIKYLHMTLSNNKLYLYNPEKELWQRKRYWSMIDLYQGKLNEIGNPDTRNKKQPLSSTWYRSKSKDEKGKNYLMILKNNTYNYFRNMVNSPSEENMFTTFKEYKKIISGKGYSKGFVSCNAKATNDFRHKSSLAYLINYYLHPNILNFFESHDVTINQDLYSLSELLQWIWRSRIREGKTINLYLPSQRMRELLGMWALGKI